MTTPYFTTTQAPAKANLDIPNAVASIINRQAEGTINSANPSGGYVKNAYRTAGPGERA
jgi:hypothetical protein